MAQADRPVRPVMPIEMSANAQTQESPTATVIR